MSASPLYNPDGSGFASDCRHCYEILQQNGNRVFYACEHCGATKVETIEKDGTAPVLDPPKTITWINYWMDEGRLRLKGSP